MTKRLLKTIYDTIELRIHPVWTDERGRALYPSWRACWETARILNS
jgi:hypothetical protein